MNIDYPLLIDGGLSNELESQGCNLNDRLWSAKMLADTPEAIIQAHLSYLKAGAKCITTASYQASIPGFMAEGFELSDAEALIKKSVTLAEDSINRYQELAGTARPYIAASIGPYGAYLADGSEYHGNYGVSDSALFDYHLPRIKLLDSSNADFFACETIPSFQEARVLAGILDETKKPAWISFSCRDGQHINDGTPIEECVEFLAEHDNIFAIGINCTAPKHISELIKAIKQHAGNKKVVVYPNSGEVYNAKTKTWSGISDPYLFSSICKEWLDLGADIIGGCCRIGPEQINSLSNMLAEGK